MYVSKSSHLSAKMPTARAALMQFKALAMHLADCHEWNLNTWTHQLCVCHFVTATKDLLTNHVQTDFHDDECKESFS